MSHFKANMHQIQFRLGLRPRRRWGAYSAPPVPVAGFKGPTSNGKGGERVTTGEGRERDVREDEERGEEKIEDPKGCFTPHVRNQKIP